MRVLLVGVEEPFVGGLRVALGHRHQISTFDGDPRDYARCVDVARSAAPDVLVHGFIATDDPLEAIDLAGRGTWNLLTTTTARRYVQLSSMHLFERYSPGWHVDEQWPTLPSTDPTELSYHLAEIASREISRARPIECLVLHLPEIVSGEIFAAGPVQPDWLHADDAVAAVVRAVESDSPEHPAPRWRSFNIVRGDAGCRFPLGVAAVAPFSFIPRHLDTHADRQQIPQAPAFPERPSPLARVPVPDRVLVFGAGGPLATVMAERLRARCRLRLTDVAPLAELIPRSGDPRPGPTEPPHEEWVVDVTDPEAVRAAATDMDCIVNATVVRAHPVEAFRVNVLGAYNTMQAALAEGIPRVVHTGPALTLGPHPVGYTDDRAVGSDVPPRPGDALYGLTKFLGQEICRLFAEQHRIACPTLLFVGFVDPNGPAEHSHPFSVSWPDAGAAMAAAVRVRTLREAAPVLHVLADAPHDRYRNTDAREVLGWQPHDRLDRIWRRHG